MRRHMNNLHNCIRSYRFHSIFFKNFLMILGLILLPFICVLSISYFAYIQIQKSEEIAYMDVMATRVNKDVEALLSELRNKAIMLGFDSDVELFCYSDRIEDNLFYDYDNIISFISFCKISTDVVENVYIYSPAGSAVISSAGFCDYNRFSDGECIDRWQDNGEQYQFEFLSREVNDKKVDTVCFYYTVRYVGGRKGVVMINISMEKLARKFDYGDDIRVSILGNGQMLYDSNPEFIGRRIEGEAKDMQRSDYEIVTRSVFDSYGLEMILHMDSQPMHEKLGTVRGIMIGSIQGMLVVSILLVFYISLKIFDPISEVLNALKDDVGDDERKILQNKDEVSYIRDSVYATISRNKDIEKELRERITLLKKAQAVALQAQINPHFINNTLETINWMVIGCMGNENDVSEMINCLSQLLRASLGNSDTFVTLREEIEYVQKYLFIQRKRLKDRFDVVLSIPQELKECKLIKIVLQPIVENAVKYGIKPYESRGEIRIEAVREGNAVFISVKDSGFGITGVEVDKINSTIRSTVIKESDHIGLSNVNQRIILAFGEEYGVTVTSKIGSGTTVMLKVPFQI